MKIAGSSIVMSAQREYNYQASTTQASIVTSAEEAASLDFSEEGVSLAKQLEKEQSRLQSEKEQKRQQTTTDLFSLQAQAAARKESPKISAELDLKIEIIRKTLEALNAIRGKRSKNAMRGLERLEKLAESLKGSSGSSSVQSSGAQFSLNLQSSGGSSPAASSGLVRTTVQSSFVLESEFTAYQAQGVVRTADGRSLSFDLTVEMSRAFCAEFESITQEEYIVTDPLVINLDTNVASVSDQKFLFDLNCDGDMDNISFVNEGSGFLAFDKNADGVINDGSELFGTSSGDGFADLALYDSDANGWIDENDDIFQKLSVWTKDADGNNVLLDLKSSGVGAIYLGSASTEFSLKNQETQETNGIIRKTGIYLKESGEAATIQHVDLAI